MYLMVMKNSILKMNPGSKITCTFDLKGSMVKRLVLPKDKNNFTKEDMEGFISENTLKD